MTLSGYKLWGQMPFDIILEIWMLFNCIQVFSFEHFQLWIKFNDGTKDFAVATVLSESYCSIRYIEVYSLRFIASKTNCYTHIDTHSHAHSHSRSHTHTHAVHIWLSSCCLRNPKCPKGVNSFVVLIISFETRGTLNGISETSSRSACCVPIMTRFEGDFSLILLFFSVRFFSYPELQLQPPSPWWPWCVR